MAMLQIYMFMLKKSVKSPGINLGFGGNYMYSLEIKKIEEQWYAQWLLLFDLNSLFSAYNQW